MVEAHSGYYFTAFLHLAVCLYFTNSSLFSIYSFKLQELKDRIIPKVIHRLLQLLTTLSPQLPFLSNTTSNPLKNKQTNKQKTKQKKQNLVHTIFSRYPESMITCHTPIVNTLVQTNNIF